MRFFRALVRAFILVAGALLGLGLFLFAIVAFATFLLVSLLTGRKPQLQFRMNRNPWAPRRPRAPAPQEVVDIEAREVREPAAPLPWQPPPR